MLWSLPLTALLMGLAGGPHCVVMCGGACAGIGQAAGRHKMRAVAGFQLGRLLGYAVLGGLAAATLQGLGWLTQQSAALRPVWTLFHLGAMALGLLLLLRGQQPVWLDLAGRRIWSAVRRAGVAHPLAPLMLGMAWALLPCGLLYSALLIAAMAPGVVAGALVMAAFSVGTSVAMTALPWLWLRLRAAASLGQWGMRLAGVALAASSGWALWMGLVNHAAPWCATA